MHVPPTPPPPTSAIDRTTRSVTRRAAALVTTAAIVLGLAACGGDDDSGLEPDAIVSDAELVPVTTGGDDADGDEAPTASGKPEVQVPSEIPTELVITDLADGWGRAAEPGDVVVVDYVGVRTVDGVEFDNSYDRGLPFDLPLGTGQVIAGWDQGLVGVRAGGRRQLDIPAELAYGDRSPSEVIRAGEALTFVIDVRAVVAPVTPADAPLDLVIEPSVGRDDLGITDVTVGDGPELVRGQTAIVHVLLVRGDNQVVMYDTWAQGDPIQVVLVDEPTLSGLIDGLEGMRIGGMRTIAIPPELGFGDDGNSEIGLPPATDMVVVAQLLGAY